MDQIWLSCRGENPADRENIGPIKYIPGQGFPGYYYPYTNLDGYLSPLIAIHLLRPQCESALLIFSLAFISFFLSFFLFVCLPAFVSVFLIFFSFLFSYFSHSQIFAHIFITFNGPIFCMHSIFLCANDH